jgi:hypothetical protein
MSDATDDSQAIHRTQLELRKEKADHAIRILTVCVLAFLVGLNLVVVGLQVARSNTNARTLQLIEDATGEEAQAQSRDTTTSLLRLQGPGQAPDRTRSPPGVPRTPCRPGGR